VTERQRHAGADWAFQHDSSALAIVEADVERVRVVCLYEWRAGMGEDHEIQKQKRDPRIIVPEAAALLRKHKCDTLMSDRHYEAYVDHELEDAEIGWVAAPVTPEEIYQSFFKLSMLLKYGKIDLSSPCVRTYAKRLRQQMLRVKRKATSGGGDKIELSSADGSHSDLLSALVLAVWQAPTVAQDGTFLRLRSRTAGFDHRFTDGGAAARKLHDMSQDYEEEDDNSTAEYEPLILTG